MRQIRFGGPSPRGGGAGFRGLGWGAAILLPALFWGIASAAQQMEVPVEVQVPLFLRILKYEKNLDSRTVDDLVVGVLYQERFRDSLNAKNDFVRFFQEVSGQTLDGVAVRHVAIDLEQEDDLGAALRREKVDVLYVTALRAVPLTTVTEAARAHQTLTLSGVPDYVREGLSVGIVERRSRPAILINLEAADAENARFSAQLLKVAQVIDRPAG